MDLACHLAEQVGPDHPVTALACFLTTVMAMAMTTTNTLTLMVKRCASLYSRKILLLPTWPVMRATW